MRNIEVESLAEGDLQRLILDCVPEGHQLEYKRELWLESGDGHKEFLNDVTAFLNASGGDLVIGMDERDGVAADLVGLDISNPQELQTGLENRIRSRLEPPVSGIRMRWIALQNGRQALVIRVPSSLSGPHRDRQSGHFFLRGQTRKDQMRIEELRDAFLGSEHLVDRLRQLHVKAVDVEHRLELPFDLNKDPAVVVSMMPLDVLRARRELSITEGASVRAYLPTAGGMSPNLTLEGVVWTVGVGSVKSFALTHRQGRVGAYWRLLSDMAATGPVLSYVRFEDGLERIVAMTQERLGALGVAGPWIVMTSLVSIAGATLPLLSMTMEESRPTRRTVAHLPDVIGERIHKGSLLPVFRDRLKMVVAARAGVIQALDVDTREPWPNGRDCPQDEAVSERPDGRGVAADPATSS